VSALWRELYLLHESVALTLGILCGWTAALLVWAAGGYLWTRAVRRLAQGPPLPPPGDEGTGESAPHLVPTRAHAGSALLAAGAGVLLVAGGVAVIARDGPRDYGGTLVIIGGVLFVVSF